MYERIKKSSQFYHLVTGLFRNKDTNEKCIFLKCILANLSLWSTNLDKNQKREQQNAGNGNEIFERDFGENKEV